MIGSVGKDEFKISDLKEDKSQLVGKQLTESPKKQPVLIDFDLGEFDNTSDKSLEEKLI